MCIYTLEIYNIRHNIFLFLFFKINKNVMRIIKSIRNSIGKLANLKEKFYVNNIFTINFK